MGKYEFYHYKEDKNLVIHCISNKKNYNIFLRIFNYLLLQIKITKRIFNSRNKIDILIFLIGGDTLLLPVIFTKILNKKVILLLAGSSIKTHQSFNDPLTSGLRILRHPCLHFANTIIVYSKLLIHDYHLTPYRHKILIAHEHFIDFTTFTVTTSFPDRPPLIGYIGRLSAEKGVQHFVQALPAILSEQQDLRVLIGGDGQLKMSIETSLDKENITTRVDLPGWISHDDLPKYLNQLRLLVLPSYTEGLPNIMLEAMACGTPVLATPVGAIPDVIRDGETGFIMEDNSPECIARNVLRALNHPDLERIAERGRRFVEEEFTFEKAVERWRKILGEIQ
ncbi:MAG: glycosyltransferase family 4 protein [Methanolinea sp.]|nr:glycosyltransferase family 4 protein [Methanolinea sp.]